MKKLLILTATLLTGGLALPAAAQSHRGHSSSSIQVFVSGHLPCGSPIYSKRIRQGKNYYSQRLSSYELRHYIERQRRLAAQRELERRYAHSKYQRSSRYGKSSSKRRH